MTTGDACSTTWDFFVSYTHADRQWAEWIAWQLEKAGYTVLFQGWDFVPGTNWIQEMQDGVTLAKRVIAVLSPDYIQSVFGAAEWQTIWAHDPTGTSRQVIPVRITDCELPWLLTGIVSVDMFGITETEAAERLQDAIAGAVAGRVKPISAPIFPGRTDDTATECSGPANSRPPGYEPPPACRPQFPDPSPYYDFMLISAEKDKGWDEWVRHVLEQRKYRIFSVRSLPVGSSRVSQIDEAIRASDRVLLILSRNSSEDHDISSQWTALLERKKGQSPSNIIAVKVDEHVDDGLFGSHGVIDLTALDESTSLERLIRAIQSRTVSDEAPAFPTRSRSDRASRLDRYYGNQLMMNFLDKQVPTALSQGRDCSLMMLDVDDLTKINKRCGRTVGDSVISQILVIMARASGLDDFGRVGEDTFFGSSASMGHQALLAVAFSIVEEVNKYPWFELENDLRVTCSIGVTQFRQDEPSIDTVRRAVQGFKVAKATGGNRATLGPKHIQPLRPGEVPKLDFS